MLEKLKKAIELYQLKGIHPVANLFPLMQEEEFKRLCEDADKNGFLNSVKINEDFVLLDGRNRLLASIEIGKDVDIEKIYPPNELDYIISENIVRRHLNETQKAFISLEIEKIIAEEASKKRNENLIQYKNKEEIKIQTVPTDLSERLNPETLEALRDADVIVETAKKIRENETAVKVSKAMGIGQTIIKQAKKIEKESPELAEKCIAGEITANKAIKEIKEKKATEYKSTFNETNDNIEWARYTWNPVVGCKHGCNFCYAKDIYNRFKRDDDNNWEEPTFYESRLNAPENTKCKAGYPNNVFVCSMADLFGKWVKSEWINKILMKVYDNPQWNFLFLTKNPERYLEFDIPVNCWLGASACNQELLDKAHNAFEKLDNKQIGYKNIKFLSCEPLLENLWIPNNIKVNWIIIGSQSKTSNAPSLQPQYEWVKTITEYCWKRGLPVYWKPNLSVRPKEMPC